MTTQEMNVLNVLTYLDFGFDGTSTEGTLQQICQRIAEKGGASPEVLAVANGQYPGLSNLTYVGGQNNNDTTGFVAYAFRDGDTTICAYRGSEESISLDHVDWADNFFAGATGESIQYDQAVAFSEEMSQYGKLIVTGHSKGGNLAMYVASQVNNCRGGNAFNSQGFPPGYLTDDEIARLKKSGMINYVTETDIVGSLLTHPEKRVFVDGHHDSMNPNETHPLQNFRFDKDGKPIRSKQSKTTKVINKATVVISEKTSKSFNKAREKYRIAPQDEILVPPAEIEQTITAFTRAQSQLQTAYGSMERALDALNNTWVGIAHAALDYQWRSIHGNIVKADERMQDAIEELTVTHRLFTDTESQITGNASLLNIGESPFA